MKMMNNPWENTRPELWRRLNNNDINGVYAMAIGVLTDADALLVVAQAANICLPLLDTGQPKGERLQEALDALPEHLKGN